MKNQINKSPLSPLFLVLANIVPVLGVIFYGWDIADILFLYWYESAIIGFYNILKILAHKGKSEIHPLLYMIPKLYAAVVFAIMFGGLMFIHVFLIYAIATVEISTGYIDIGAFEPTIIAMFAATWTGILSLFISHGYSFIDNYFRGGERERSILKTLLTLPFSRIWLMQVTLICGAFLTLIFGRHLYLLLLFIALKTAADLSAHLKERGKFSR